MYSTVPIKLRSVHGIPSIIYGCRFMLQMKQDADDFVRTREQTTQPSVKIHQHLEIEQFDVHNVTLGPGPVSDLSAVDGNDCHQ